MERRDVEFVGLSGTSAGAIVAALAASGFRADDLIHSVSGRTILAVLNEIDPKLRRATDLFGSGGWLRIRLFRLLMRQPLPGWAVLVLAWATPPAIVVGLMVWAPVESAVWFVLAGWTAIGAIVWLTARTLIGGLADVGRFRNALDKLLQRKLFPDEPGRTVRMDDFGKDGRPRLKIVSANLSTRALHLFSAERTPGTAVADAVAASICLPMIFRPWVIEGATHIDGGIVSNLPAWPFDEERELDPEALTIAVEIEDTDDPSQVDRFSWLPSAIRTALFGSGELNLRVAGPAEQLALPTRFKLLDFDKTGLEAAREVREVASAVGLRLDKRLFRLPEIYQNACQVARALTLDGLGIAPGGKGSASRVRVAVGRLERGYVESLRLSHSVGFDDDPDEFMLVPLDGSVAGAAWRERQSQIETFPLSPHRNFPGLANRLRRKTRWTGLAWVMCIPILQDGAGEPRLLVQIDGNTPLPQDAETAAALASVEEAVNDFFSLVLQELKELEDDHDPEEQLVRGPNRQSPGRGDEEVAA